MENKFRTVFATGNPLEASIVQSLLEQAGIPCMVLNGGLQNLFGIGQFGVGFNPIIGEIKVQVPMELEQEARDVMKEAEEGAAENAENEEPGEADPPSSPGS